VGRLKWGKRRGRTATRQLKGQSEVKPPGREGDRTREREIGRERERQ